MTDLRNDNVHAMRLGMIARAAGADRTDVGDDIDRGLVLLKMLNAAGYLVERMPNYKHRPITEIIAEHEWQWTCDRCSITIPHKHLLPSDKEKWSDL